MREIVDGGDPVVPATIDDEQVLADFRTRVTTHSAQTPDS
jgi:hypothetical protein